MATSRRSRSSIIGRLLTLALLPLFAVCLAFAPHRGPDREQVGLLMGEARATLIRDWDAQPVGNVMQSERAYCVTSYTVQHIAWHEGDSTAGSTVLYIVRQLVPAKIRWTTPWVLNFDCPADAEGHAVPSVHTHPASDCNPTRGTCVADSTKMQPGKCLPSPIDVATARELQLPFAIVQCGRTVWTFYAPT